MRWTASRILREKKKLLAHPSIVARVGCVLQGKSYAAFAREVCDLLPGTPDLAAVRGSLQNMLGVPITKDLLEDTLWRLLGNLPALIRGETVLPWSVQRGDEWVPVQVLQVIPSISVSKQLGVVLLLQSLAGTCCPQILRTFWSRKQCFRFAKKLGFSSPPRLRVMRSEKELTSFRFYAGVREELSAKRPQFDAIEVDSALLRWNKKLIRLRTRPPGVFSCPEGFPPEMPCYRCYAGLDRCPVATHESTYQQRFCNECRSAEAWHDPSQGMDAPCLQCNWRKLQKMRYVENR